MAGSLATNNINSMMARGDTLWLALDDQGIAALNVKTGDVRRYESSAGINATNQFELGDTSREIAAIGGMNDLSILENGTETWKPLLPGIPYQNFILGGDARRLAGQKDKLLLYNSQLLLLDLNSKKWTRIADSAVLEEIGHIRCLVGDGRGNFWIASSSGLHSVNPDTGRIRSQWIAVPPTIPVAVGAALPGQGQRHKTDAQLIPEVRQKLELRRRLLAARKSDTNQPELFVPSSRLPAGVLSVATDDDFLWVFTADATHPLLYHPDSHSWVGGFSIRHMGAPSTLTCGDGKLWLATAQGDRFAILKVNTSPLKSTPRERWLTDAISQEELSARVSEMSEHERAVYLFFAGNDEAVIQLLQTRSEDVLGPESLFLLASAFSEIGQPAQAAHFGKKLAAEFPGSVYTTLISYDRRLMVTRMKIEQSLKTNPRPESTDADAVSAWMMRVLDADGDGALEQNELAIFFELEPEQTQRLVFNSSLKPAAAAAELIQRFDRNRDERLQRNELTDVIRSTAFLRGWPRSSRTNQPVHHPTQTTNQ